MGERGPKPQIFEDRPVSRKDYDLIAFLLLTDYQQEAGDWLKSFTPKERGELLELLKELWEAHQARIIDIALER